MYNCLLLAGGIVNGADCTGHAKVVNATVWEVQCLPAVNTVELPVVEAMWELLIADPRYTTACYKVVLFQNQSIAHYEKLPVSNRQASYRRLLVNASMSVAECDSSFKAAFNTTRSSSCCQLKYHQFLAVNPNTGSLIILLHVHGTFTVRSELHGKNATCSTTGSNGRTANSSFTIVTRNSEPNYIAQCVCACMRIVVM